MENHEQRVEDLLTKHRDLLENVAQRLLSVEVIEGKEFDELVKAEATGDLPAPPPPEVATGPEQAPDQ